MRERMNLLTLSLIVMASLTLAAAIPAVQAAEFSEAELFFELNNTDGDLGIHASIDGGPYSRLEIEDPNERVILIVESPRALGTPGPDPAVYRER